MDTDYPDEPETQDGRRLRSQDSRKRIVQAMLELVHGGDVSPAADKVAARARVGLRTVFRHFKDMDSLYAEMAETIEGELRQVALQPFTAEDWRERVVEIVHRRSGAFERVGPFRRASDAHRHRSPFLEASAARLAAALRELLRAVLPPEVANDLATFEALDLLLSFESWMRLRREQRLGVDQARAVLESAVRKLIA
ncbi:MAG: TetR/AcrR family transcriptional regulator [Caulobacteraceae bacterium]|nr:TetR/AcrR family transcriptional regulator [Caulobacteraceae bacterium]